MANELSLSTSNYQIQDLSKISLYCNMFKVCTKYVLLLLGKVEVIDNKVSQIFSRFIPAFSLGMGGAMVAIRGFKVYKNYVEGKPFTRDTYAIGIEILAGISGCFPGAGTFVAFTCDGSLLSHDLFFHLTASKKNCQQVPIKGIKKPTTYSEACYYFGISKEEGKNLDKINSKYLEVKRNIEKNQSKTEFSALSDQFNDMLFVLDRAYDILKQEGNRSSKNARGV